MALTDTWLKVTQDKIHPKRFEKNDGHGLGVRVSPKGKIVFQIKYCFPKGEKSKRLDLGSYPDLSLKRAREVNTEIRVQMMEGIHPLVTRDSKFGGDLKLTTFKSLFEEWFESVGSKKTSGKNIQASIINHVLPTLGKYPAAQICTATWVSFLEKQVVYRPQIALRLLTTIKQVYFRGISRRLIQTNPVAHLSGRRDLGIKKKKTTRVLSDNELIYILRALDNCNMAEKNKIQVELCLLYACRIGELRTAEISHFDFKSGLWTIPPEGHKTGGIVGMPIVRPIIGATKPLIKRAFEISGSVTNMFTNVRNPEKMNEQVTATSHLTIPKNLDLFIYKHYGVLLEHWSLHDLRRTARTNFTKEYKGEKITSVHVAEIMLGHSLPGVQDVYDLNEYLPDQAKAYKIWAEKIAGLRTAELPDRINETQEIEAHDSRTLDDEGEMVW